MLRDVFKPAVIALQCFYRDTGVYAAFDAVRNVWNELGKADELRPVLPTNPRGNRSPS